MFERFIIKEKLMHEMIEKLKSHLIDKYNCHTIILYGSYAVNDYTEDSDIDIICFTDEETKSNDTSIFEGKQLDVWIVNTNEMDKPEKYLHIMDSIVLHDENNVAYEFVNRIKTLFDNGTESIDDDKKKFLKDWLKKMYKRTLRNDAEGLYRHHWMLKESLEIYFEINNMWFLGVKKSLRWLEENDHNVYLLFYNAFKGEAGSEESKKLIDYIYKL